MTKGFEEAQTAYSASGVGVVGEVRRFGSFGPAYEVIEAASASEVVITVIESGETLRYAMADLLADPVAITVP